MVQITHYKEKKDKYSFLFCSPGFCKDNRSASTDVYGNFVLYHINKKFEFTDIHEGYTKISIYYIHNYTCTSLSVRCLSSDIFLDKRWIEDVREVYLSRDFLIPYNLDKLNKYILNDSNKKIFSIIHNTIILEDNINEYDMGKLVCFLDRHFREKVCLNTIENNILRSCSATNKHYILERIILTISSILGFFTISLIIEYYYTKHLRKEKERKEREKNLLQTEEKTNFFKKIKNNFFTKK